MITVKGKDFEPYILAEEIQTLVSQIGGEIPNAFNGEEFVVLCILNGAFVFTADLCRTFDKEICTVEFIKLSSYEGTQSTGIVKQITGLQTSLKDKNVLVVEDIVDTGNTLSKIIEILNSENPKSLKIASLLLKPTVYSQNFKIDFVGKEIPDHFVLGYGLDFDGYGRNLKDIYKIIE